ncbi:hypothetical protein [Acidithiobacillus thiooxidans]|nr:hypothetical protein [Acidithiobacillus thiooxidans]
MIFKRNLAALGADKDLYLELLLEGFLAIIGHLTSDHAQSGTTQAR